MHAAAFQLIRNVLHSCGTLIALRPEDNSAAATLEIVEAALASHQSQDHIAERCRIPSVVSEIRIEPAATPESPEHELLGDLLEAQAATIASSAPGIGANAENAKAPVSAAVTVAETTLRVDAARIDAVMNLVGELIIGKSMLNRSLTEFDQRHARDPVRAKLSDALAFQSRVLDELHKCVLKIRMVPVEQLFRRFPRLVRDVAKQCGKDVALELSGQNTDLDKSILDALAEPLMHLVRNAVDHGVEDAEERIAANKPARGTVYLNAYHQGTQVVIEVRDDGRGIDLAQIRQHAVEKGIVKAAEIQRLTDSEVMNLIFEPGFSTAAEITEVSGRGVGMDVVRTVIDNLKGTVHVSSVKGRGATIQLRMPLTLASIQTLLFRVGGRLFAVPLSSVVEITRITDSEIHRVDQREVLRLREQILTLVRLNSLSQIHAVAVQDGKKKKRNFVIVIGAAEKRFGLVVDSLVGEEELVIKALPTEIISSDLVSGASILGDGTVVLILNVPAVLSRLSRATPLGAIA
jgi:two-component system chemotaxis sensor kinase CheA